MKQHGFSARGPPLVADKEKQSNPNVSVILNMDEWHCRGFLALSAQELRWLRSSFSKMSGLSWGLPRHRTIRIMI